jgi:hypothetical protein
MYQPDYDEYRKQYLKDMGLEPIIHYTTPYESCVTRKWKQFISLCKSIISYVTGKKKASK